MIRVRISTALNDTIWRLSQAFADWPIAKLEPALSVITHDRFIKVVSDADPLAGARAALEAGAWPEVEASCRAWLRTHPDDAHAFYLWGCAAAQSGRLAVALEVLTRASQLAPDEVDVLIELARLAARLGRVPEALRFVDRALGIKPDRARLHYLRGNCLRDLGDPVQAIDAFRRSLAIDPSDAACWLNLGNLLRLGDEAQAAIDCYDRALTIAPDFAEAWINRGVALGDRLQHRAALQSYARARRLAPSHPELDFNEALVRLQRGDYERGWALFEARWQRPRLAAWRQRFAKPAWDGTAPIEGLKLLVYAEQGRGDALQFARYLPWLVQSGAKLTVEVDPALVRLFATVSGVEAVVGWGEALPAFDAQVSIASLPGIFKTRLHNIPAAAGYLQWPDAPLQPGAREGAPAAGPVVGLVWRGSPRHPNDARRSLSLEQMLVGLPDKVSAVCLQPQISPQERALLEARGIYCFDSDPADFAESGARLRLTDVLLTADTAMAHLAGALGHRAWVLLPFNPDWRWLTGRRDSPWYASVTLFRQRQAGDWRQPLAEVRKALSAATIQDAGNAHD